jgi:hypothetical protein
VTEWGCYCALQADTTAKVKEAEAREAELRHSLAATQVILASTIIHGVLAGAERWNCAQCLPIGVRTYWGREMALRTALLLPLEACSEGFAFAMSLYRL